MKKHYVILMLMVSIFTTSRAQTHTSYGEGAGAAGLRGSYFGRHAGNALISDDPDVGDNNSFFGDYCGQATTSRSNTGVGSKALFTNTTGSDNVAIGSGSRENNTTGVANAALGSMSMNSNTTGGGNTAVGTSSLIGNTTEIETLP